MADVLLVAIVLTVSTVAGYPACRLLPVRSCRDRLVAAPVVGFALLSAATILCYKLGVPPQVSLRGVGALGTLATVIELRRERAVLPGRAIAGVGAAAAAIVMMCLLPGWIGGAAFKVFQGNVYDQFYSYLTGSIVFHRYSYDTVISARGNPDLNPVVVEATQIALTRPIAIVHAAFAGTHATALSSAYAFLIALQVQMFFSALFMALSVFKTSLRTGIVVAGALTVGFFQQYVVDIDAWSELSTLPVFLLIVAVAALSREFWAAGTSRPHPLWRVTALYGVLFLPATLIYPEAWAVYAVAGGTALLALVGQPKSDWLRAALGIAIACASTLLLSAWFGSLAYLKATTREALTAVEWWRYYQAYVVGPGAIAGAATAGHQTWPVLSSPWLVRPVDTAFAIIGLYWVLPGPSVPAALAAVWRLGLCVFLVQLVGALLRVAMGSSREQAPGLAARTLGACGAGLLVPTGILAAGLLRTAGKALSMASPLLFFLIAAPLLIRGPVRRWDRAAAMLFVAGHLFTGVLRPVLAGSQGGTVVAGLPGSAPLLTLQKAGMDWRMDRVVAELKGCDRLIVDVRQTFMDAAVQLVATELDLPWGSTQPVKMPSMDGERLRPAYQPPGWEGADCLATDHRSELQSGRRVIWLVSDREAYRFLDARSGTLELGLVDHPGVTVEGAYAIETTREGRLRWTSGRTTFRVPNSADAPATSLLISCWAIQQPAAVTVRIVINGWVAFDGPVPFQTLTIPLARTAKDEWLDIEVSASPLTRFPADPRDLGIALRRVTLEKHP